MAEPRPATPADNDALVRLFAEVPMEGELVLATMRGPRFAALYDLHGGDVDCWVQDVDDSGPGAPGATRRLAGVGTIIVREGWLDGRVQKVGYLGDLRIAAQARRSKTVARFYGPLLQATIARTGCDCYLTAVLASNTAALQALTRRRPARAGQPHYQLLRRFDAVSVQFAGRRRAHHSPFSVSTARPEDVAPLARFLDADHRGRAFGFCFGAGELERRLATWPGFRLDATYIARDRGGQIVGCTTAWDPAPVKQYRVLAYRGKLAWVKRAWNGLCRLTGWPPLPDPGQDFRSLYLCNLSVSGDDPAILRALLERLYADFRPAGYHFFTLYADEGDPLRPALRGFTTRTLPFLLFAVAGADRPGAGAGWPAGRTGFEIALA